MTTDSTQVKCKRCGRVLRSAKTAAVGIGRTCALREARENALKEAGLTEKQQAEALELLADGAVIPSGHKGVWLVLSRNSEDVHKATPDHCTCMWGLWKMTSATVKPCKHAGAVRARLAKAA